MDGWMDGWMMWHSKVKSQVSGLRSGGLRSLVSGNFGSDLAMTAEDAQTVTVEVQCSVFTHQYGDKRGQ